MALPDKNWLKICSQVGELTKGALADVIALPYHGRASSVYEAVLHHAGDVSASLIDGRWAIRPPSL